MRAASLTPASGSPATPGWIRRNASALMHTVDDLSLAETSYGVVALLVAHAEIGDAFLLRRRGDRGDRKPDDPEQMIDALPLQASRDQGSAIDLAHGFPLVIF